jgi:hypothetical protein
MTILVMASNFEGLLPKAKMIDRDAQKFGRNVCVAASAT